MSKPLTKVPLFTSDLHFKHTNILTFTKRPYANVEEMEEGLIANWNQMVTPEDSIYVLGDFSFANVTRTCQILDRLNGTKHLIWGNHDVNNRGKPEFMKRWASTNDLLEIKVPDTDRTRGWQRVIMCHFALKTWHKQHKSSWNLFGHSHGSLPDDPNSLSMDVGVDVDNRCRPFTYEEIKAHMALKKFTQIDHHGSGAAFAEVE